MEEEKEQESIFLLRTFGDEALREFFIFSQNAGPKVIFLSSGGGQYTTCMGLLDVINRNPEEYTIRVSEYVMSSALQLIRHARCKIEDISSQYNLDVMYLWHSSQSLWVFKGLELKCTQKADQKDFMNLQPVLTTKQIRRRSRYVFFTNISKHFARIVNDDIWLTHDQVLLLLGDKFSVRRNNEV